MSAVGAHNVSGSCHANDKGKGKGKTSQIWDVNAYITPTWAERHGQIARCQVAWAFKWCINAHPEIRASQFSPNVLQKALGCCRLEEEDAAWP